MHVLVDPPSGEELPTTRLRCCRAGRPSSTLQWDVDIDVTHEENNAGVVLVGLAQIFYAPAETMISHAAGQSHRNTRWDK